MTKQSLIWLLVIVMQNPSVMADWDQLSAISNVPLDNPCESSLSTPIGHSHPLNTIETAYRTQQQACESQLERLRNVHQVLTDLQKQVQNAQTDVFNQKLVFETSQRKFAQCHQFELTENACSADEQTQTYQAFHKALQAYQKSQQVLTQHQQQMTAANEQFTQEQSTLKSIVTKLDDLRQKLAASSDVTLIPHATEGNNPVFVFSSLLPWLIKAIVIIVCIVLLLSFIWWVIQRFSPLRPHAPRIMGDIIVGITVLMTTTLITYYLFGSTETATISGIILAIAVHYFMKEA